MISKIYNKTLLRIFFVLFLVALIMFLSNYIVFRNSMNAMYEQVSENNKLVVKGMVRSFDQCFKEVNNLFDSINALPYNPYEPGAHKNLNTFDTYQIEKNMGSLVPPYDYLESAIVFYNDSELAITPGGTMDLNYLMEKKYYNGKYSSAYWRNFAVTRHPLKVIPSAGYSNLIKVDNTDTKANHRLLGVVGSNQLSKPGLNMLVFIYEDKLLKYVNEQTLMNGTSLTVLDQDKNIIIDTGEDNAFDNLSGVYFESGNETTVRVGQYEYYCVKSDYNGFVYINKIPYSLKNTAGVLKTNQIVLLITLFLGIVISAFLSLYLYRPVRNILKLFSVKSDDGGQNKYTQIYKGIEQIKKENESFKNKVDSIDEDMKRSTFLKMVDEAFKLKHLEEKIDLYFNGVFDCKQFFILSFNIKRFDSMPKDGYCERPSNMSAVIQKELEAEFQNAVVFYLLDMQFVALIGINQDAVREEVLKVITRITEELNRGDLKDNIIFTCVSKFYLEMKECRAAYNDIQQCAAYRNINLVEKVIDIEEINYYCDWYFPTDVIEKLNVCIVSGNGNECIYIINEIIERNIEKNTNYTKFKNIITNVFGSIIHLMVLYGLNKNETQKIEQEFFQIASNMSNYVAMRSFLNAIVQKTVDRIKVDSRSKFNKDFIIQHVNLHYNEDLYLDNMAELLGTSPNYFSSFFKKAFGINFVEYLNKVRISHAKEYIKNTEMSINEIGGKVGFYNKSTFASTFKKCCGISPSEYRREKREQRL